MNYSQTVAPASGSNSNPPYNPHNVGPLLSKYMEVADQLIGTVNRLNVSNIIELYLIGDVYVYTTVMNTLHDMMSEQEQHIANELSIPIDPVLSLKRHSKSMLREDITVTDFFRGVSVMSSMLYYVNEEVEACLLH